MEYVEEAPLIIILSGISFKYLKGLTLCGCRISSVEVLSWVEMPELETLYIHYNSQIVSVKCWKKANWNHLDYMSMRTESIMQRAMWCRKGWA